MVKQNRYSIEIKMAVISDKLAGLTTRSIMEKYGIRNKTQVETWVKWFKRGESNRLSQPVGKQYSFGKGPVELPKQQQLEIENKRLTEEVLVLKKFLLNER